MCRNIFPFFPPSLKDPPGLGQATNMTRLPQCNACENGGMQTRGPPTPSLSLFSIGLSCQLHVPAKWLFAPPPPPWRCMVRLG